jgi:hypothetical protein
MLLGDPTQNPFSTESVKMRRTRIEHMSSAYYPIATAKRTFLIGRFVPFPEMGGAIPFLTHEHMLYRLEQLLQAGRAEVSICKMGSFGAIGRHFILNSARRF